MADYITCPVCHGSGRKTYTQQCPRCINGRVNGNPCGFCNGTGVFSHQEICTQCGGHGKIHS